MPFPRALPYAEKRQIAWRLGDGVWGERTVLWVSRPGQAYAVGMFWHESESRFLGWYVNLQAPLMRSPVGFDTIDHILDIEVAPDRSWKWKDEDEFADALRFGRFTASEGARIHAAGEAAIAEIEQRAWPFDAEWEGWQPGAGWPIPVLQVEREAG